MAMSGGSSGGRGGDLNAEINVTPLVDVMLVLLVIFMVTAPMLTTGVDIDLPQTTAPAVEDPKGQATLSIQDNRQLFLSGKPITWGALKTELETSAQVQSKKELYVEAAKDLPYGVVVTAMAVARQAGVTKLQMLTDAAAALDLGELDRAVGPATGAAGAGGAP
jgi:biopolymer transport protein TolR